MSPWHWLLVIAVAVLLFGARRLPDAARSLGRSARILKSELNADRADGEQAAPGGNEQSAQPEPAPVADTADRPDRTR